MRALLATLAVVVVAATAVTSAGASSVRSTKLSPAEQTWATPVVALWNAMNAGLSVVPGQTTATNALVPGTAANKKLIVTLGNFLDCSKLMSKAKAPPTARLKPFAATMKNACAYLATGAHGVANGISTIYAKHNGKLSALQIQAAFGEFKKGSTALDKAQKQLLGASR